MEMVYHSHGAAALVVGVPMADVLDIQKEVSLIIRRTAHAASRMPPEDEWVAYQLGRQALSYLVGPTALHDEVALKTQESYDAALDLVDAAVKHSREARS